MSNAYKTAIEAVDREITRINNERIESKQKIKALQDYLVSLDSEEAKFKKRLALLEEQAASDASASQVLPAPQEAEVAPLPSSVFLK